MESADIEKIKSVPCHQSKRHNLFRVMRSRQHKTFYPTYSASPFTALVAGLASQKTSDKIYLSYVNLL